MVTRKVTAATIPARTRRVASRYGTKISGVNTAPPGVTPGGADSYRASRLVTRIRV